MSRPKHTIDWLVPSQWERCYLCRGKGHVFAIPPRCPKCKGEGRIPTMYRLKTDHERAAA